MKRDGDLLFANEDFPLIVEPQRTSSFYGIKEGSNALHGAIEIKYFYEGSSTLLIGERTIRAEVGDIVVINPYEFHATVDLDEEKGKYHLIMVGLDFFEDVDELDLRRLLLGSKTVFRTLLRDASYLRDLLLRVVEEYCNKERGYQLIIRSLLTEFFVLLLRRGTETDRTLVAKDMIRYYAIIEPALRQIRDNYSQRFDVEQLATMCNVSKYHFCRVFKRVTGESSIHYLNSFRLKVADALLKNTEKSVAEISRQCGFEDEGYFCRCYKRHFGDSPLGRHKKDAQREEDKRNLY